jgi:RimJ/RimL family protein N-acetyltransferase
MRTVDAIRPPSAPVGHGPRAVQQVVRIRAIRSTDSAELKRFYCGLSNESRRTRFLYPSIGPTPRQCRTFCTTDHDHREGFIAIVEAHRGGHERIVGHLCMEPDRSGAAEVAIAVAEDFQHQGIARLLLAEGIAWARRKRVAQLTATMFAGNAAIQRLLLGLGLPTREGYVGAGVTEITIDLGSGGMVSGAAA